MRPLPRIPRGRRIRYGVDRGILLVLLLPLLLAGCGFQPRGELPRPPADMQPLYLAGMADSHPFLRELRRELQESGTRLADERSEAKGVIRIRRLHKERRVFSVNANNKVVEYEILYTLKFVAERPPGKRVLDAPPLEARRIIYEPGGQLLGRVREADLRERDVYADLARRLIRQLAVLR